VFLAKLMDFAHGADQLQISSLMSTAFIACESTSDVSGCRLGRSSARYQPSPVSVRRVPEALSRSCKLAPFLARQQRESDLRSGLLTR
jgi:hypothetical protein